MFYDVYICVVCSVINKRFWIMGPRRGLGHWVGGADLTRLVFTQKILGGRQKASILPVTSLLISL